MRKLFTYEFATCSNGRWQTTLRAERRFSRDSKSIARSLLEQWVVTCRRRLPGGRIIVCGGRRTTLRKGRTAHVRVTVFPGGLHDHPVSPAAAAYLADSWD